MESLKNMQNPICEAFKSNRRRSKLFFTRSLSNTPAELQVLNCGSNNKNSASHSFAEYVDIVRTLLPDLPEGNIVGEPVGRDTGPCAALAAALVGSRGGDGAVMMMLPADHVIKHTRELSAVLEDAAELARKHAEWLFTIGIPPTSPATGYGYIQCGEALEEASNGTRFFRSLGFREKPDRETAERFLASGDYRWNSGIFL